MKWWGIALAALVTSTSTAGAMIGESRESGAVADKQVAAKADAEKKTRPVTAKKSPMVEVKLDVLESLERLQERQIKEPRRAVPQP